jgi:2-C-methyl-D-erythritol 4-phosphate cytidylyltransferase/2-C-methyl-D-erythritol 2,4-cyclodiphosphate synthase
MSVWAVVVAGGHGRRFGGLKQFEPLAGRRVLDWSVDAARSVADGVVVVLPAGTEVWPGSAELTVPGGLTRSASVRAGLGALPEDVEVVVVHDAARPVASPALFRTVIGALDAPGVAILAGAIPALAVTETVKRVIGSLVMATVARDDLVRVQTPQAFRRDVLAAAHRDGAEGTDDAALVEAAGGFVVTVPGEPSNIKVTSPADLALAEWYLRGRAGPRFRTGLGFDVHPFSDDPARVLLLGGVSFEGERGLAGHSDGDVVCHAVADALLGAVGLGDLGGHFSDRDTEWEGADSLGILARVAEMVTQAGWRLANADCSVVLEVPRLAPHRQAMSARLSEAAGGPVSVKAKRAEGLGALGRSEGIACWATALVEERG